jgi:hypothetical protein
MENAAWKRPKNASQNWLMDAPARVRRVYPSLLHRCGKGLSGIRSVERSRRVQRDEADNCQEASEMRC